MKVKRRILIIVQNLPAPFDRRVAGVPSVRTWERAVRHGRQCRGFEGLQTFILDVPPSQEELHHTAMMFCLRQLEVQVWDAEQQDHGFKMRLE